MSEQPSAADDEEQPPPGTTPEPSSATAPDPEDWQSTGASSDDERYLRERPPHWE